MPATDHLRDSATSRCDQPSRSARSNTSASESLRSPRARTRSSRGRRDSADGSAERHPSRAKLTQMTQKSGRPDFCVNRRIPESYGARILKSGIWPIRSEHAPSAPARATRSEEPIGARRSGEHQRLLGIRFAKSFRRRSDIQALSLSLPQGLFLCASRPSRLVQGGEHGVYGGEDSRGVPLSWPTKPSGRSARARHLRTRCVCDASSAGVCTTTRHCESSLQLHGLRGNCGAVVPKHGDHVHERWELPITSPRAPALVGDARRGHV